MGPILLHMEATYRAYKTPLEHIATEIDSEINRQCRIQNIRKMEFGSVEKVLTKAIEHVFPKSERLLCARHLKDNIKHYCQNKVGMPKAERENIMARMFVENGLADANTTIDFDTKSEELDGLIKDKYPMFAKYFKTSVRPRLRTYVFKPNRKKRGQKTVDEQQRRSCRQTGDPSPHKN